MSLLPGSGLVILGSGETQNVLDLGSKNTQNRLNKETGTPKISLFHELQHQKLAEFQMKKACTF